MPSLVKCYISAPAGTDLSTLRDVLRNAGAEWVDQSHVHLGQSLPEAVSAAISAADFVCAVIPEGADSANVFYDLGFARAQEKPVLVFVEHGRTLPSFLQHLPYAKAGMHDRQAMVFQLTSFLRFGPKRRTHSKTVTQVESEKPLAGSLEKASGALANADAFAFEQAIYEMFQDAGVAISQPTETERDAADLALWLDSVHETFGGPVLVELKAGRLSEAVLREAEDRLRHHIFATGGEIGVLVYLDRDGRVFDAQQFGWPTVVRLSADELMKLLGAGRFEQELIRRRNHDVHGGL